MKIIIDDLAGHISCPVQGPQVKTLQTKETSSKAPISSTKEN